MRGKRTSAVELSNVSAHGFWLFFADERKERFLPFASFPWFEDASIAELADVRRPSRRHLHWPALDVDLAIDSIDSPDRFPLVSRKRRAPSRRTKPLRGA